MVKSSRYITNNFIFLADIGSTTLVQESTCNSMLSDFSTLSGLSPTASNVGQIVVVFRFVTICPLKCMQYQSDVSSKPRSLCHKDTSHLEKFNTTCGEVMYTKLMPPPSYSHKHPSTHVGDV